MVLNYSRDLSLKNSWRLRYFSKQAPSPVSGAPTPASHQTPTVPHPGYAPKRTIKPSTTPPTINAKVVLEARVQVGAAAEVTALIELRREVQCIDAAQIAKDIAFVRQYDESTWRAGPIHYAGLPLLWLLLGNCPEEISKQLRSLNP